MQKAALDLGLTSNAPIRQALSIASAAKRTGVHGIWIGEDIGRGPDVFVLTSAMMLRIPDKKVGIGVTSPAVHNITTIARAAVTLSGITPRRFRLGLGVGGLQDLSKLGVTSERPVGMLRDAVRCLRRIWAGETLTVEGESFELQRYFARYQPRYRIPIYLGVRGPKLLRLAGRIADGVLLSGPVSYLKKAISMVRSEAAERGTRSDFRVVVWTPTLVMRRKSDRGRAKVVAATVIADTPLPVLQMAGVSDDAVHIIKRLARESDYKTASDHVTDVLLDSFTISGNPEQITEVFQSLEELGADEIVFGPPYGHPVLRSVNEVVEAWESA